jgi:hypothetical protein
MPWAEYQDISSDEGKEQFFNKVPAAFARCTLRTPDKPHSRYLHWPIVENAVGDPLFHPHDVESVTRELALLRFSKKFGELQRALLEDLRWLDTTVVAIELSNHESQE